MQVAAEEFAKGGFLAAGRDQRYRAPKNHLCDANLRTKI
jgi:hypothetical protein